MIGKKSELPDVVSKYIINMENSKTDGWLRLDELVDALDTYSATIGITKQSWYRDGRKSPCDFSCSASGNSSFGGNSFANRTTPRHNN